MLATVGDSIEVFWPLDNVFYSGRVVDHNPTSGIVSVLYDDGEVEHLDLSLEKWRFQEHDIRNAERLIPAKDVLIGKDQPYSLTAKPKTLHKPKSNSDKLRRPEWSQRIILAQRLIRYCLSSWSRNHIRYNLPRSSHSLGHCLNYVFNMLSVAASNPMYCSKLSTKAQIPSKRPRASSEASKHIIRNEPIDDDEVLELVLKASVRVDEKKFDNLAALAMSIVLHAIDLSKHYHSTVRSSIRQ